MEIVSKDDKTPGLYCGFCGKGREEVEDLIKGPNTYICNECVKLCTTIIAKEPEGG